MKLFKVAFHSGKEEEVPADSWELHDGFYMFYRGGHAIEDILFPEQGVAYINVLSENMERDFSWQIPGRKPR